MVAAKNTRSVVENKSINLKETYNKIAKDWHNDHKKDDWWIESTDKFISLLKPGLQVLDVGCGGGVKSKYFIERGLKVVGIDFSREMIRIAKTEVPEATFLVKDLKDINKWKAFFDGIFLQAVLLHLPKQEILTSLRQIVTKLKTGGYLYIAVKEKKTVDEEIRVKNDYGYEYETFFSYFTEEEIKSYLKSLSLELVFCESKRLKKMTWIQAIARK